MVEKTEREKAQTNIAENRKAFHDFHLLETFEAGVALLGTEVKAIREGRVNLRDSFARVEDREEIRKLIGKTVEKGMTLIPVRLYFKNGRVKVAVSLAKGKQLYDKRETERRRETERETRAAVKARR